MRDEGLRSCVVRTGKKSSANLLFPMSVVDFEADMRQHKSIHTARNLTPAMVYSGLMFDPVRSAIAIFMGEILHRTLQEDYVNPALYDDLLQIIHQLDTSDAPANLALLFMVRLCGHYGFDIELPEEIAPWHDLIDGHHTGAKPSGQAVISGEEMKLLIALLEDQEDFPASSSQRRNLLNALIAYLRHHLDIRMEINSVAVLQEVFG
jgi:DNA repair protein RecO (recombination protein O)